MIIRNSGFPANLSRSPQAVALERARRVLSIAMQHVPQLVTNGTRIDMAKWRDLVRSNIADLASRGQPLDEEIMRNYFPHIVEQAVCIHGNWNAALRDFHKRVNIVSDMSALSDVTLEVAPHRKGNPPKAHSMNSRSKRVIDAILSYAGAGQNLRLAAMLNIHPKIVKDGIDEFGTWKKAVEAAGLNYSNYGPYAKWTDEDFLKKGQELVKEEKFDLVFLFTKHLEFAKAVFERFENWGAYAGAVENYVPVSSQDSSGEAPSW